MSYFSRLWIVIVFSSLLLLTSFAQAEESFSPLVEDTIKILKGLRSAFEVIHSAEEEARGKPAPDVYLTAARKLGVAPAACVAISCPRPPTRSWPPISTAATFSST